MLAKLETVRPQVATPCAAHMHMRVLVVVVNVPYSHSTCLACCLTTGHCTLRSKAACTTHGNLHIEAAGKLLHPAAANTHLPCWPSRVQCCCTSAGRDRSHSSCKHIHTHRWPCQLANSKAHCNGCSRYRTSALKGCWLRTTILRETQETD
jgi:hypothetical protein